MAWPGLLVVLLLQAALAIFEFTKGPFGKAVQSPLDFTKLAEAERLLAGMVLAAIALLISIVVHHDAVPQIDLDWLVRPIQRWQLAAAKLAFFVACIHLPMLIIDITHCLATGFDLPHSLVSALSRNLFFLIGVTVPLFALAVVSRNVIEFIVGAALLVALIEIFDRVIGYFLGIVLLQSIFSDPLEGSNWIIVVAKYLVIGSGSALVIAVQYYQRKTGRTRAVLAGFVIVGFSVSYLPWQVVFGAQDVLVAPGTAFTLSLDIAEARLRTDIDGRRSRMPLGIPLRVSGLPDNARLVLEWDEVAGINIQGHVVGGGVTIVTERAPGPWLSYGKEGQAFAVFVIDAKTRDQIKDWPAMDLDLDLAVTLLEKMADDAEFPVSEGYVAVPRQGRCRVTPPNRNVPGSPMTAECVQAGPAPAVTAMEAFSPGRAEAYAGATLRSSYAPFFAQFLPDSLNRTRVAMMPRGGLAIAELYPDSHIVMRNYRTIQHRKFHLKLAGVRIQDVAIANNEMEAAW